MSLLWIFRSLTALVSLLYVVYSVPWRHVPMSFDPGLTYDGEGWHAVLVRGGALALYVSAVASVVVGFLFIPRWRLGNRALSWCFLLMGFSLLARMIPGYWNPVLPWVLHYQFVCVPLIFAMPPFILAVIVRHPVIEREIQGTR